MESNPLILIVEDDKPIRNFMRTALSTQGYRYKEADKGGDAMALIMAYNPDVIILDLGLPDMDGLEIIKKVREWSDMPIVVVSARGQERDKVEALDLGADDYLTKPFSIAELLARVRVAIRHYSKVTSDKFDEREQFSVAELVVDFSKRRVSVSGEEIHLTPIEYKLIALLASHPGKVMTHNHIIKEVWGSSAGSDMQSLRVFMANIRRKIEKDHANPRYIRTEVGVGYRMVEE